MFRSNDEIIWGNGWHFDWSWCIGWWNCWWIVAENIIGNSIRVFCCFIHFLGRLFELFGGEIDLTESLINEQILLHNEFTDFFIMDGYVAYLYLVLVVVGIVGTQFNKVKCSLILPHCIKSSTI